MTSALDHMAALTQFRDREVLDINLATSLFDLLQPRSVAIYRLVGEAPQRWMKRASLAAGDAVATADPAWVEIDTLPLRSDHPFRDRCVEADRVVEEGATTLFPLRSEHAGVSGVLEVCSTATISTQARALVRTMLDVFRNFESLLDYSERDTLTGLLNRKTFDETFFKVSQPGRSVAGHSAAHGSAPGACLTPLSLDSANAPVVPAQERRHHPALVYWLAMVDIDHFKSVNDRFGHLIGDEVLLLLARIMRSTFRLSDRMYRFGGEEFLVLLPADSREHAALALERFRLQVEKYRFPQAGRVTVSVGFTEVHPGDTPGGAFERADKAVYHSKAQGRNRLTSHEELVARGILAVPARKVDVEMF